VAGGGVWGPFLGLRGDFRPWRGAGLWDPRCCHFEGARRPSEAFEDVEGGGHVALDAVDLFEGRLEAPFEPRGVVERVHAQLAKLWEGLHQVDSPGVEDGVRGSGGEAEQLQRCGPALVPLGGLAPGASFRGDCAALLPGVAADFAGQDGGYVIIVDLRVSYHNAVSPFGEDLTVDIMSLGYYCTVGWGPGLS